MRVAFDRFVFDSERRELLAGGDTVHLPPKAFRLLELLIAAAPRVLSKKELVDAVWPETFVEESNLAGLVNDLRAALGDTPRNSSFIRTVHGYGYAFCGRVEGADGLRVAASVAFRGETHPLREGDNVLGRDASADVQIDDPTVSRRHARITLLAGAATVEDLDSKNGTFVDARRIAEREDLADGTIVTLGDAELVFRTRSGSTTITRVRTKGE